MAEIKSTLDLVMEKTRHLTLSRQEKEANEQRALSLRLQGLLQKREDGLLDLTELEEEITRLLDNTGSWAGDVVCRQVVARMTVERENSPWIELLARFCGADVDRLQQAAESARMGLSSAVEQRIGELRDELASRGIRGSAVQPNLDGDPVLEKTRRELQLDFTRTLEKMIPTS